MKQLTKYLIIVGIILVTGLAFILSGCTISDADFKNTEDVTAVLQNKIMELDAKNKELEKMNGDLLNKISILETEKTMLEKSLQTIKEEYEYYLSIYNNLDNDIKNIVDKYEATIKEYTNKIDSLEKTVESYEKLVAELKKIIEDKQIEYDDIFSENLHLKCELERYINLLAQSEKDNIEVVNGYKKQIKELEKTIETLEKELDNLRNNKTVYIKGKMNGDYRNWLVGSVNVNNIDLTNGYIDYNGYRFYFYE